MQRYSAVSPTGVYNRLQACLPHVPWYSIEGYMRLAEDVGTARSTIIRLARGHQCPSYKLAQSIADALSHRFGKPIDIGEIFSLDGAYPTGSTCYLFDCSGCLPHEAWNDDTCELRPRWRGEVPGRWAIFPERRRFHRLLSPRGFTRQDSPFGELALGTPC